MQEWGTEMRRLLEILVLTLAFVLAGCDGSGGLASCEDYASRYSCSYVIDDAEYEVWYWRNVADDNEKDNQMVGRAKGLRMCENTARAFAAAIGEEFNYRAYICHLMKDGRLMEKHRFLDGS